MSRIIDDLKSNHFNEVKLTDLVKLNCVICNKEFKGPEPQMCCDGHMCGCQGLPVDPIVCSDECYDKGMS